jgi:3-methyladenine DNA glycosylase AlkD
MTAQSILDEIRALGRDGYKSILLRHGAKEPCYGVKIEELKKIQKRIKRNHRLALELYDTGVYDAMYLAGLIADDAQMTRADLERWVAKACGPLAGSTVPAVAAGSPHAWEAARDWIRSDQDLVAAAGWATLSCLVSITPDDQLDLPRLTELLGFVKAHLHGAPDPVRYQMNGFVISVGCYVPALTERAKKTAEEIGRVEVDMGDTACQVPFAPDYIRKVEARGALGKKRKTAKC